ncbi:unnamed protein product [Urochloa decumbens]|uniref:Terpene synthase metal-binding domain-containing protein n=1 Tax=Urochloa decumbens TaxID=240449 RepID=A0ABC9AWT6_9POAL
MAVPGEDVLDDAISFTSSHLKAMKGNLGSPLSEQVSRALDIPLPRYMLPLESMHYITEYEKEEAHNAIVLELARLDHNINRLLHLKELRAFCLWWKGLYRDVKLTCSRDRAVEMYFWAFGLFQGEHHSHARIMVSKIIAFISLMDDTYDTHATFEECNTLNEAFQSNRWDESAASNLPEYLRAFYIKIITSFNEFDNIHEPGEKYRASYVQEAYMFLSKYYLKEVQWCNENYMPSFKDQLDLSSLSSSIPVLTLAALMAVGDEVTKEAVEWARGVPDMVHACGEIGLLLNDISAFKIHLSAQKGRKQKNDVANSLECYMMEHGTTAAQAATELSVMIEHAWRRINQASMAIDGSLLPAVKVAVINLARANEIMYCGSNDKYTFTGDLEGLVTSLFLKSIPV